VVPDDHLRRALDQVECDLNASAAELQRLQMRVTYLQQSRAGLRGLLGLEEEVGPPAVDVDEDALSEPSRPPQAIDAVRMVLEDRRDTDVHIDDVRAEMSRRAWNDPTWTNPNAAVYAALNRLTKRNEHVERVSRRFWRYHSTPAPTETSSDTTEDLFNETEDEA
jgi:hypothetical protein